MNEPPIRLKIKSTEMRIQNARLRMPFRFGIATLTEAPILMVRLTAEDEAGRTAVGLSSDILPALWFDKTSDKSIDVKIGDQIEMARAALEIFEISSDVFKTPFELWWSSYAEIKKHAADRGINSLTAGFGSAFAERATIDAGCRLAEIPFFDALRGGRLGLAPGLVHHELAGFDVASALPESPLTHVWCRHTVGLGDPLHAGEIDEATRIGDGLPETLEDDIRAHGLRYFKIKIQADREANLDRLRSIARILDRECDAEYSTTLDGNEQIEELGDIIWLLEQLESDPATERLRRSVLFIEQPLPRDAALALESAEAVRELAAHAPLIIDESDNNVIAFPLARDVGYSGISCKACKGIFKAVLNRCLVEKWNAESGSPRGETRPYILSSEDLTNTGVVPLHEDMATIAALGINHAERNGHHYFNGLGHLSAREQASALRSHSDLYAETGNGAAMRIEGGRIAIGSLQCPGFGYASDIDFEGRMSLDDWRASNG